MKFTDCRALRGIIPPVVTPLMDSQHLDMAGLERLLEHQITGGVHGVFMLGTNGEAPSLTPHIQCEVIRQAVRIVAGRVPVLAGVSSTSLEASLEMAHVAAGAGCVAAVAAAPYYLPLDQTELEAYFRQLARRSPLPLVLYNFPQLTKVSFSAETVRRLLDESNIVGMKDSSGDLEYFGEIVAVAGERRDFRLLAGKEVNLARIVELGGHGGVCSGGNVWPRLLVDLFEASVTENAQEIAALSARARQLGKVFSVAGNRFSSGIAGIKAALEVLGICSDVVAPPILPATIEQKAEIKDILQSAGLL